MTGPQCCHCAPLLLLSLCENGKESKSQKKKTDDEAIKREQYYFIMENQAE